MGRVDRGSLWGGCSCAHRDASLRSPTRQLHLTNRNPSSRRDDGIQPRVKRRSSEAAQSLKPWTEVRTLPSRRDGRRVVFQWPSGRQRSDSHRRARLRCPSFRIVSDAIRLSAADARWRCGLTLAAESQHERRTRDILAMSRGTGHTHMHCNVQRAGAVASPPILFRRPTSRAAEAHRVRYGRNRTRMSRWLPNRRPGEAVGAHRARWTAQASRDIPEQRLAGPRASRSPAVDSNAECAATHSACPERQARR